MKTNFLLLAFCSLFYSFAQAQWTTVKKFAGEGNLLEIDSTGIYVQNGNQLFLKNDTANWKPYPIEGKVNDMLLLKGKLYYTFNSNLNQYNFGKKPTWLEDSAEFISAQGKELIFYNFQKKLEVKKYVSSGTSIDLLNGYGNTFPQKYLNRNVIYTSDDSIIALGFNSGYYGGHIYKNSKWFSPLNMEGYQGPGIIQTLSINEGKILGIIGKSCERAYYSGDYGKTEKVIDISSFLNDECWGKSKILAFKNSVFLTTRYGVYATDTSFKKWDKILLDSNIVDAQVWGSTLYALTSKATLLSYDLNNLITSTEYVDAATNNSGLQYVNGIVYNKSDTEKSINIKNVIGKTIYTKNLSPQSSETLELTDGIYFLYEEGVKQKALKICVVN